MSNAPYTFEAFAHYYGGTNIARCNGCMASSTNSPEIAAIAAARKHFRKVCAVLALSPDAFADPTAKEFAPGKFSVTFTSK